MIDIIDSFYDRGERREVTLQRSQTKHGTRYMIDQGADEYILLFYDVWQARRRFLELKVQAQYQ